MPATGFRGAPRRLQYYAFHAHPTRRGAWVELLVTREGGRQVSQEPTGTVYRTWRECQRSVAEKNGGRV